MNKNIDDKILSIRGYRVMLDSDLAELYGVTTKRLNEQVKRNVRYNPYVFTEHGAVMLASILNSKTAVEASIHFVRAFVRFRSVLGAHKELARKIDDLEKDYDKKFRIIFTAIKQLMNLPQESIQQESEKLPLGFQPPKK